MSGEVEKAQQDTAVLLATSESRGPESQRPDAADTQPAHLAEQAAADISANGVHPSGTQTGEGAAAASLSEKTEDNGATTEASSAAPGGTLGSLETPQSGESPSAAPPAPTAPYAGAVVEPDAKVPEAVLDVVPDKITRQDVEKAEEASVKMLAANLEGSTPNNGELTQDIEMEEAPAGTASQSVNESPAVGEKRKAADLAGANGDASNKKSTIESPSIAEVVNENSRGKGGRPRREKKALAPVGKTARRTRSQGRVEI